MDWEMMELADKDIKAAIINKIHMELNRNTVRRETENKKLNQRDIQDLKNTISENVTRWD